MQKSGGKTHRPDKGTGAFPRIIIAGTHSGCGKTTVATGIMAALAGSGHRVQPFKVGPDFIDPSHHTAICGRDSRNLDPFMMGDEGCRSTFSQASGGADIAVIEGVMGLFDGIDGTDIASTAHVARILDAPVVLVIDARGSSRSVHALIRGFSEFDPSIRIAGVIFNRIGSPRHRDMISRYLGIPSFGWIPRNEEISVNSRHLGLVMAGESDSFLRAGQVIRDSCDLDAIVSAARGAPSLPVVFGGDKPRAPRTRIGIARDRAFCFYYRDNLDALQRAGAELVFFSPLSDRLPPVDALYLGGGYPELYLSELESSPCTTDIRKAADDGVPVYAECGGLMYMTREIAAGKTYRMTGILPAVAEMTKKIQGLGYVKGTSGAGSFLSPGREILGHEFHYSRLDPDRDARYLISLSRGKGITGEKDGLCSGSVIGAYTHAYFSPGFARDLVDAAISFSRS